ncbi:hypothetical protein [Rhizobium sp. Leaf386]|uniref:hypothetical protein n=1 Tax=Rhizobium sp. Leaf386 TaxID=1736359 RepID=UPI0012E2C218|nr:hypothetical protein [Rhizobium sp. Leaf386]
MRDNDMLRPGSQGTLSWSRGGEQTGWIRYRVHFNALELNYKTRPAGGEWQPVNEQIAFARSDQPFGGSRLYLVCPRCRRRCVVMYGGSHFRCRRCLNLAYSSQSEDASGRAMSKAQNIRKRLGDCGGFDDPFPDKPKGMHWETYHRLKRECAILEERVAVELAGMMMRLGGGI